VSECGAQGEFRPGRVDEAGWTYDSRRNKLWVFPGFYFLGQSGPGPCGGFNNAGISWSVGTPLVIDGAYAIYFVFNQGTNARYTEGVHYKKALNTPSPNQITLTNISIPPQDIRVHAQATGAALQQFGPMAFNLTTKAWEVPSVAVEPINPPTQQRSKNACYDSVTDSIWRAAYDSGTFVWLKYNIVANKWDRYETARTTSGEYVNYVDPGFEYIACDIVGRKIYLIDPIQYRLIEFDMTKTGVRFRAPIPEPNPERIKLSRATTFTFKDFTIPVWDSVNKVLLYPYLDCVGCAAPFSSVVKLLIYNPATDRWETDPMTHADGQMVMAASAVFDPTNNVLMTIGGLLQSGDSGITASGFDVWRYGATLPRPIQTPLLLLPQAEKAND
jgi:hypothetical protein